MIRDMMNLGPDGAALSRDTAHRIMDAILSGSESDADIARFLETIANRGERREELEGMLDSMMDHCVNVKLDAGAIDVCGTGGDGAHTFNISTAASFVAAAAGARVAKHGNRSSSGATGSADIFERLGARLDPTPDQISQTLDEYGIAFMFAPHFHPAVKNAARARKALAGKRTAFNLLGPLANPARVTRQLVGVSSAAHLDDIPAILAHRGSEHVIAVRSENGMDELSTSSAGTAIVARDGGVERVEINARRLGLRESEIGELQVSGADEAFSAFVGAIDGTAGSAMVETVALNAGAALAVAHVSEDIGEGVRIALESIRSGESSKLLDRFTAGHDRLGTLEEARSH